MEYHDEFMKAAHAAADGVNRAMQSYHDRFLTDEDDITGVLVGNLQAELQGITTGHLRWRVSLSIPRHRRGVAAEESLTGADILIHVALDSSILTYSKGLLIQAKRNEPNRAMRPDDHDRLVSQCEQMLMITPAAFVFAYARGGMRCGSANLIAGAAARRVYDQCVWTPYRFFLELFRCPIGDKRITSAHVSELPVAYQIGREVRIEARDRFEG
jgi:hypothetical protein